MKFKKTRRASPVIYGNDLPWEYINRDVMIQKEDTEYRVVNDHHYYEVKGLCYEV